MPEQTPRIVLGILPVQFRSSDAPAVIGLAAAAVAIVAAVGNDDHSMVHKLLNDTATRVSRMRPEVRESLMTVAAELIQSLDDNKEFTVLGGFSAEKD